MPRAVPTSCTYRPVPVMSYTSVPPVPAPSVTTVVQVWASDETWSVNAAPYAASHSRATWSRA